MYHQHFIIISFSLLSSLLNRIILCVLFSVWLLSFNIVCERFIHVAVCINRSFPFHCYIVFCFMNILQCIYPFSSWWKFEWFSFGATTNKASMNVPTCTCFLMPMFKFSRVLSLEQLDYRLCALSNLFSKTTLSHLRWSNCNERLSNFPKIRQPNYIEPRAPCSRTWACT